MKPRNFLLVTFIILLLSGTGTAAYSYTNNIALNSGNATWEYEEYVTGREASFSRQLIDIQAGNNDSFVNVWELIGMERKFGENLHKSIEKKPDIRLNNSSEKVRVMDVEYRFSEESLGSVFKTTALKNRARVSYVIEKGALAPGTEAWLRGTPESKVTLTLPPGLNVNRTEWPENSTINFENGRTVLKGEFDEKGELTVRFSENKSFKPQAAEEGLNTGSEIEKNESAPEKPGDPGTDIFNYYYNLRSRLARALQV